MKRDGACLVADEERKKIQVMKRDGACRVADQERKKIQECNKITAQINQCAPEGWLASALRRLAMACTI